MNIRFLRIVVIAIVAVICLFFIFTPLVSAQGMTTIAVRINPDINQPAAQWDNSDLTEARRFTTEGTDWVEVAHPTWNNVYVIANEWDVAQNSQTAQPSVQLTPATPVGGTVATPAAPAGGGGLCSGQDVLGNPDLWGPGQAWIIVQAGQSATIPQGGIFIPSPQSGVTEATFYPTGGSVTIPASGSVEGLSTAQIPVPGCPEAYFSQEGNHLQILTVRNADTGVVTKIPGR